jgi:DNA-nicking Smr family endonuclease
LVKTRKEEEASEEDAFARAMKDERVVPLVPDSSGRVRVTSLVNLPQVTKPPATDDPRVDADVDSGADFVAHGVDRREIRKLKRGDYSPASRYDLHGLTADAASAGVKQFLASSCRSGRRCVCIVHGRGLRSPGGVAVLKRRVRALLRSHTAVLAFADAPRGAGGAGAVYVLLRRHP